MAAISDHDILGDKIFVSHEEVVHNVESVIKELTEHELAIEKKLCRKIDTIIMPLVVLVYLMNYIDRNNYASARLSGLEAGLHLKGDQYQVGLSIFFASYVLAQLPSNLLLNYCGRPSWYLGFFIIAWGLVSAVTSQVKSYGGIVACRFVLGLVEAPFFPGVLFYLSKWYTKRELSLRMSLFYAGSLVSGAFGNLIAAGILKGLNGKHGMAAWQWLYIVEGTITVFVGFIVVFFLPEFPDTWKALTSEQKLVANRRLAIDAAEADMDAGGAMSQIQGMMLALKDPKTYMLSLTYFCITGAAGFQNFFPTLTATLGYSKIISLLLVAPPYVFMVFWSLFHSWLSDRMRNRFWFFIYPIPLTIAGFIIFMTTDTFGPRYFSFFLMVFVFAINGTQFAWISSSIPRPPAKRAAALAIMNALGNSTSIWTPFTYRKQDAPHYRPALACTCALQVGAAILAVTIRSYLQKQNRELERLEVEDLSISQEGLDRLRRTADVEGVDLGAARLLQKGFRYMI
ncbi:hypothetical protein MBLNU459_g2460t1 [Dothideomycetes sp. NU459]